MVARALTNIGSNRKVHAREGGDEVDRRADDRGRRSALGLGLGAVQVLRPLHHLGLASCSVGVLFSILHSHCIQWFMSKTANSGAKLGYSGI